MTVNELLSRHTSAELAEQQAYDLLRMRNADEAEQARALNRAVEDGLHSIKKQVKS
jgi:hypothetical protein